MTFSKAKVIVKFKKFATPSLKIQGDKADVRNLLAVLFCNEDIDTFSVKMYDTDDREEK